jgi:23S rRNA G2069 N7-methylase RlmK/C1962 C5-methylase RlmI
MGWHEVDKRIKQKIFSFFVSCTEAWEMDFIREIIMEEVPHLNEEELSKAMIDGCKEIAPPRPRTEYLKYLQQKLELELVNAEK